MNENKAVKPFSMKRYCWTAILLWLGAMLVWLGRYPTPLAPILFDNWKVILTFSSGMIAAFGLCSKYQWRTARIWLIVMCVLFTIGILNISMWMTVYVQNNTAVPVTAVLKNLSDERVRIVAVQPGKKKRIEVVKAGNGRINETRWHLLVYDKAGSVYTQQVIKGSEIKRGHTIQID